MYSLAFDFSSSRSRTKSFKRTESCVMWRSRFNYFLEVRPTNIRYHRPLVLRTHLPFRSESIVLLSDDAIAQREPDETPPKARNFLSFDSVVR